jgi:hypothetical protein
LNQIAGQGGGYRGAAAQTYKATKEVAAFKDEAAERRFWATHDSAEYVDWSKAERVTLPNLRSSLRTISLRVPESMIAELKLLLANKHKVSKELRKD